MNRLETCRLWIKFLQNPLVLGGQIEYHWQGNKIFRYQISNFVAYQDTGKTIFQFGWVVEWQGSDPIPAGGWWRSDRSLTMVYLWNRLVPMPLTNAKKDPRRLIRFVSPKNNKGGALVFFPYGDPANISEAAIYGLNRE